MDFEKLIAEALSKKDWTEIINIASQARELSYKENMLGLRYGNFNVIYDSHFNPYHLKEDNKQWRSEIENFYLALQKNTDYVLFAFHGVQDFNTSVKKNEINANLIKNKCVVIFTGKVGVVDKLRTMKYPTISFVMNKYREDKAQGEFLLKSRENGTKYLLTEGHIRAAMRDERIERVLAD